MRSRNKGERNGNSKLTDKKIIRIRRLKGKATQPVIAERFGVSVALIGMIMRREIWRHVRVPR